MMKTNRQIVQECAQAAWSWLCERYGIPIPSIQQMFGDQDTGRNPLRMPSCRVSMTHKKSFYAPGKSPSKPGEVIIAGKNLSWLPHCSTKNSIESWTLQLVEEFTRAIELNESWEGKSATAEIQTRAVLNQINFVREFFPHLYLQHRQRLNLIARNARSELKKSDSKSVTPTTPQSKPGIVRK